MPRPLWKGAISFGLVHVPVSLLPASRRERVSFDTIDKRDFAPEPVSTSAPAARRLARYLRKAPLETAPTRELRAQAGKIYLFSDGV
jgi:hypothetical protein